MSSADVLFTKEDSHYNNVDLFNKPRHHYLNAGYIKQTLHERKIDEFFWTNATSSRKRTSIFAAIGAFIGVMTPILFFSKKQNKGLKLNSFKNIARVININYELPQILAVGAGGVLGGLAGGLADRKEIHKIEKIEEGTFQLMNVAFPAVLVDKGIKLCKKSKYFNNNISKIAVSIGSIIAGASGAVIIANKIDDKLFDKYIQGPDRKLKKKDFIVHVDDFFGTLVLAKFPLANKLQVEKILPLIYTWSGYHVGDT